MEQYLSYSKAFLAALQSAMTKEELDNCMACAEEIYQAITPIIEKHNLNIREALNTVVAVNTTVVELAKEQMEERRNVQ
ncbi:hypothetical protein [Alicyclobacillus shizuokensis]|uniref:hypothetical protein n=1 Tax=Alicyclobacillus shizuokensis TaxID=392014 RepID=UPI000AF46A0B|nr:hypothetical protein [Alicyclobacillus shizuokensis]